MYDRQVRRRRAVLLALVVCCLVLLTAYFGESSGGPLKSVQTGAMEISIAPWPRCELGWPGASGAWMASRRGGHIRTAPTGVTAPAPRME